MRFEASGCWPGCSRLWPARADGYLVASVSVPGPRYVNAAATGASLLAAGAAIAANAALATTSYNSVTVIITRKAAHEENQLPEPSLKTKLDAS